MAEVIDISVDIGRFNILMGLEYADSWAMFISDNSVPYKQHIEETEKIVAQIRAKLAAVDLTAYNKNFSENLDRAFKIYEQVPGIRAYWLKIRPGDDREARKVNNRAYTDIADPLGASLRSLVPESNELPIRLRIQTLVWATDLHNRATTETGMYCWGHELGMFKSLENAAGPEIATQMRRDLEKHLLANTVPELKPYFRKIFSDPVYLEADTMVRKFKQADTLEKHHFDAADLPVWRELTEQKRYKLLVEMQPYVLGELQTFANNYVHAVKRERVIMLSLLGVVAVASAIVAWLVGQSAFQAVTRAVAALKQGAQNLLGAANETADAGTKLADVVSQQAAALEETAASLEELTATNKQNADNAQLVAERMRETDALVQRATSSMNHLVKAVQQIADTSGRTKHIAGTIDEIAFQTNILALNASVEAARAGEAGAGFAVIAEEVRQMAIRAASESASIARLIEGAHALTAEGVTLSEKVDSIFQQVEAQARTAGTRMKEIQTSTHELVRGIDEINNATRELDTHTQQNAAIAEENASTAELVKKQTSELTTSIALLEDVIGGPADITDPIASTAAPRLPVGAPAPLPKRGSAPTPRPTEHEAVLAET
jgi:methyl-accepting chemotaxis protein